MYCSSCGNELNKDEKFCPNCGTENLLNDSINRKEIVNEPKDTPLLKNHPNIEYVGFFPRLGAYLIDIIFMVIILIIVGAILGMLGLMSDGIADRLGLLVAVLYFSIQESSKKQATFGKQIMHIKVVDINLQRISFGRAVGRYFSKMLSALILCIGYIMIFFTDKKQALHDKIVSTLVIREY